MVEIRNVTVVGGSGQIGTPILQALIESGKFNISVLSRESSTATFPSSVKVLNADYSSLESLTQALKGQDAVVSAVGTEGLLGQALIFDAANAAGVKRFIPSEYGCDTSNAKASQLPVFGYKVATAKHLETRVAEGADITYSLLYSGPFLDWGLKMGFLLAWQEGKPTIYDGGDRLFSTTTLASVGLAVVQTLLHYEDTKNRVVKFSDIGITQNKLLEIAKKVAPKKEWEPQAITTEALLKSSNEKLAKGDMNAMVGFILVSIFNENYGGYWPEENDNKLLGLPGKTEADVEEIFKKLL